jgi:hypothetical protein
MSKRVVAFNEISYELLARAEARVPHELSEMRSGSSKGPIKMWVCDRPKCGGIEYTYVTPHTAPMCAGGATWSFTTSMGFVKGLHREELR